MRDPAPICTVSVPYFLFPSRAHRGFCRIPAEPETSRKKYSQYSIPIWTIFLAIGRELGYRRTRQGSAGAVGKVWQMHVGRCLPADASRQMHPNGAALPRMPGHMPAMGGSNTGLSGPGHRSRPGTDSQELGHAGSRPSGAGLRERARKGNPSRVGRASCGKGICGKGALTGAATAPEGTSVPGLGPGLSSSVHLFGMASPGRDPGSA